MKTTILSLLIINSLAVVGQTDKIVMGTFAMGCQVFNYEFRLAPNGLFSFGIDQISEQVITLSEFDNESITEVTYNLNMITDSLNTLSTLIKIPDANKFSRKDSIIRLITEYQLMLQEIKLYMAYEDITAKIKGRIPSLLKKSTELNLNKYDSLLVIFNLEPKLKEFNKRLAFITNNTYNAQKKKSFAINEFKQETFVPLFENLINEHQLAFQKECKNDLSVNTLAISIFYQIKAKLDLIDDEPITAYLKLKNQIIRSYEYYSDNATEKYEDPFYFSVENVSVEFEDGTIKNIFADLRLMDDDGNIIPDFPVTRFKNLLPISISSRNDKDYFSFWYLDISDFWDFNMQLEQRNIQGVNKAIKGDGYFHKLYIYLSDVIDYVDILETNKEDYSPANVVVNLNKNNAVVELRKERRSRLLTVKAFTDLVGIDDDQPNGLIQFEASRRFNLNTVRKGSYDNEGNIYHAYFSYLEPKLTFSKIEQNNNTLLLQPYDIDTLALLNNKKVFNILPINLLRYQTTSFDVLINILKYNFPNIKSNVQFDLSAGIFRTNVSDTVAVLDSKMTKSLTANDKTLNTLRLGCTIIYEIKPDSRYGLNIVYDFLILDLLSDQYVFPHDKTYRYSHAVGLEAYLKTNDENTLFFRYKFSFFTPSANEQNYTQIQMGYLVDLFKTRKN